MNSGKGESHCVTVNGQRLHVRLDGSGNAPWLVFSNSLACDLSQWDAQVAAFGSRFSFLRYDQRGHGGSDAPSGPFAMDDLVDDLLVVLERFSVERAVLMGVSMGATTALRCAARKSSCCLGVVACDGVWKSSPGSASVWEERFAVVREQGMRGMAEPTVRRWFQPDFFEKHSETVDSVRAMIAATKPEGYLGCAGALQDFDFSADYPGLAVPTLFVAGEQDGDTPAVMKEMASATPNGRYHGIGHCGHLPNIEQPEQLFAVVDAFVRELGIE